MKFRMDEVGKVWGGMQKVFECKSRRMSAKRSYEGIMGPKALIGDDTWNMRAAQRKILNIGKLRCLRNVCEAT